MYEVTGLKQNRPNTFQDALYNDYNKKALVKFIFSIWVTKNMQLYYKKNYA